MVHNSVNNLIFIQDNIKDKLNIANFPTVIAVSKKFRISEIIPLINHGHKHFGENQVQEALEKWTDIKNDFQDIKLHMVGKLQTNKVKYAVNIFDFIHSLDNYKLAEKISSEQIKIGKKIKIFIQVNIGNETQKNGIDIENLEKFHKDCVSNLDLDIIGLMCLPPNDKASVSYFSKMKDLSQGSGLNELSMGMSNDYIEASEEGSTFVRIGSKIFGERPR